MSWWALLILVTLTWILGVVVGAAGVAANVATGKRPSGAGFSWLPIFPGAPLAFFGIAMAVDAAAAPWGTRIVAGLHAAFVALWLAMMVNDLRRLRAARSKSA